MALQGTGSLTRRTSRKAAHRAARSEGRAVSPAEARRQGGPRFACPLTKEPMMGEAFASPSLSRAYRETAEFVDLSIRPREGNRRNIVFDSELVASIYELGWRQSFIRAGFPGPDEELDTALSFMGDSAQGIVVDLSCGSGLFTRRLATRSKFDHVRLGLVHGWLALGQRVLKRWIDCRAQAVAMDASESMLRETSKRLSQASEAARSKVWLVRADAAQLPLETSSVDCLHAGAAIHCWPFPELAVSEIARVLKPGGVMAGSTFLEPLSRLEDVLGDDAVAPFAKALRDLGSSAVQNQIFYWTEPELRDLFSTVGLTDFRRRRKQQFILFAATKPQGSS